MKELDSADIAGGIGVGALAAGVGLIYFPAALIVVGVAFIAFAIAEAR